MKIHSSQSFIKQRRTWLIVSIVAVAIIICIATILRHRNVISRVDSAYNQGKATAKLISSSSKASRNERFAAIRQLGQSQTVKTCSGEWWGAWYSSVPAIQAQIKNCNTKLEQLELISKSATKLNAYLKDDDKVAKTLAILKPATGSNNWQKVALSSAQSARRDIEAINVTSDNKKLLRLSEQKVTAIIDSWTVLNQASAKEDKAAYLTAHNQLAQAYADLGAIADASDEQIDTLLAKLQAAINKA